MFNSIPVNRATSELRTKAYDAGFSACKNNKPHAPALSKEYMDLIKGFKIGDGASILADEFLRGYYDCFDEELAEQFADDEYFQHKVISNKQNRAARKANADD